MKFLKMRNAETADGDRKAVNRGRMYAFLAISAVVVLWVIILVAIGEPMLRFAKEPEAFRNWIREYGILGDLIFIGMIVLQVVVAIIPGEPLEIVAGYAFGTLRGTFLCMIGFMIGSTIIYFLSKRFGRPLLELFFSKKKIDSLTFLKSSPNRNVLLFIIMMIPGTPKDLISYFAGLTNIKLRVWLVIVAVSRIPSLITSTIGGDALGMQNYTVAIVFFVVTAIVSAIGILIYSKICNKQDENK